MQLERNKSDKKDAGWICRYAIEQVRRIGKCPTVLTLKANSCTTRSGNMPNRSKRFNNQLHSLRLLPVPSKDTIRSLEKMKQHLEKEIESLEEKLEAIATAMATGPVQKCRQR